MAKGQRRIGSAAVILGLSDWFIELLDAVGRWDIATHIPFLNWIGSSLVAPILVFSGMLLIVRAREKEHEAELGIERNRPVILDHKENPAQRSPKPWNYKRFALGTALLSVAIAVCGMIAILWFYVPPAPSQLTSHIPEAIDIYPPPNNNNGSHSAPTSSHIDVRTSGSSSPGVGVNNGTVIGSISGDSELIHTMQVDVALDFPTNPTPRLFPDGSSISSYCGAGLVVNPKTGYRLNGFPQYMNQWISKTTHRFVFSYTPSSEIIGRKVSSLSDINQLLLNCVGVLEIVTNGLGPIDPESNIKIIIQITVNGIIVLQGPTIIPLHNLSANPVNITLSGMSNVAEIYSKRLAEKAAKQQ
jgi:hypothetical protein